MLNKWTLEQALGWMKWRDMSIVNDLEEKVSLAASTMYQPDDINEKPASERLLEALGNNRLKASGYKNGVGDPVIIESNTWGRLHIETSYRKPAKVVSHNGKGSYYTDLLFHAEDLKHCFKSNGSESIKKAPRSKNQGQINDTVFVEKINSELKRGQVTSIINGVKKYQNEIQGNGIEAKIRRISRKIKKLNDMS